MLEVRVFRAVWAKVEEESPRWREQQESELQLREERPQGGLLVCERDPVKSSVALEVSEQCGVRVPANWEGWQITVLGGCWVHHPCSLL